MWSYSTEAIGRNPRRLALTSDPVGDSIAAPYAAAMPAAVLLGLLAAVFYGVTDFVARFAGRSVGPLRMIFYGHAAAAATLFAVLPWSAFPRADLLTWGLALASDAVGLIATACLYRALAVGSLSVVAPVVSTYGVVTTLLATASGERLTIAVWAGIAAASLGGVLVARPRASQADRRHDRGLVPAALASLTYGVSFWIQGRFVIPHLGVIVPVESYYVLGLAATGLIGWLGRHSLAPPRRVEIPMVLGVTALACAGSLALAVGQTTGHTAVVTALSAVGSAVTVLLARILLHERVPRLGWLGLGLTVAGVALLRAA